MNTQKNPFEHLINKKNQKLKQMEEYNKPGASWWGNCHVRVRMSVYNIMNRYWEKITMDDAQILASTLTTGILLSVIIAVLFPKIVVGTLIVSTALTVYASYHTLETFNYLLTREKINAQWGSVIEDEKLVNDTVAKYSLQIITREKYIDLLTVFREKFPENKAMVQSMMDNVDTITPYYATRIAQMLKGKYKIDAWSVIELMREPLPVEQKEKSTYIARTFKL